MKPQRHNPHTSDDTLKVVLGAGDFYFGRGRTRISTLLGSCVSITLWHPRQHIGGMCHYMLTERKRSPDTVPDGRYASEAFDLFLQNVEQASTRPTDYQAKLFGGANMLGSAHEDRLEVGARNIEYARRFLASHHIAVIAEHVRGSGRRKLHFDLWSGDVWLAFPDGEGAEIRNDYG